MQRTEICVNKFIRVDTCNTLSELPSTSRLPTARSGHRAVADCNNIWIIGGFNPDSEMSMQNPFSPLFRELWRYNVYNKKWSLVNSTGTMPTELASHSALIQEHYMIVFGGTGFPFGENSSNKVSICNLENGQWKVLNCSGNKPDEIYGQAMAIYENDLYVFGGTTGFIYNSDLYRLDLNSCVWERLRPNNPWTSIPTERYRHEIVVSHNKIIVLGGGTSDSVCPMVNIPVYDIENNTWINRTSLPDMNCKPGFPKPRRCHSCVQLGDNAYVCGGYDDNEISGDLWKINLITLQWTKIADMPKPVYFHAAAITSEGCMYVFGGVCTIIPTERTEECYRIWVKIPSLQTLCWTTVVDCFPHLLKLPHSKILPLGVLKEFLNKLPCPNGA